MILRISHGYEVKEMNDPFVEIADKATHQFSLATAPGGYLVDLIPACGRFLPVLPTERPNLVTHSTSYSSVVSRSWIPHTGKEMVRYLIRNG